MSGVGQGAVVGAVIGVLAWCYITYDLLGLIRPVLVLGALGFSGYHAYLFLSGRRGR
ncbi:MAG TPA: hypothetical protein VKD72_35920 [Gemmataceae bacterium]|nr:hypothetical protein [Gemmataceae bacterium]